ncbi:hypothetical protein BABINDRAFT_161368 [Babjeviella inositovora NRRL Y-12698]|uniref:FAD/NAD(P)-binding domain-containing protein n=1 Tax=Babjeviella inositovora NRRL Y-12698 TaxID=984486 RepID=A0A1E3QU14_9ASCO|nr:uncharacterized protein BABINDRAFT_161368 [Babjeviella inositovora NRRL Y-12698]ODQ80427.1 hypothetical protein BABINDRAFT_161368 [Babjeviella inositovora NRRL Y-12698]
MKQVAIIGGSYAGLSALKVLITRLAPSTTQANPVTVTLLEPKTGMINILGLPRSICDNAFASKIYSPINQFNIPFDSIQVEKTNGSLHDAALTPSDSGLVTSMKKFLFVNYIQTRCFKLTNKEAHYIDPLTQEPAYLKFDHCVLASGRARPGVPFDPISKGHHIFNKEDFLRQQKKQQDTIEKVKAITVIGGGAFGIETAGELQQQYGSTKKIRLIHPYEKLLPEPTIKSEEFRDAILEQLEAVGCEVLLELRVLRELDGGNLQIIDKEGEREVTSELNYWCHSYANNLEPLSNNVELFGDCLTGDNTTERKRRCVNVNEYFQIASLNDPEKVWENIYAVGDLVALPILKTAGSAFYIGKNVGENIATRILDAEERLTRLAIETWPVKMVIVVGSNVAVTLYDDVVTLNDKGTLSAYADYRTDNVAEIYDIKFGTTHSDAHI